MKKLSNLIIATLAVIAPFAGCQKNEETETIKQNPVCEIGNTGKVISSYSSSTTWDGSSRTLLSNFDLWYSTDCSKMTAYDLTQGIPDVQMMDYSYVLQGQTLVENEGRVIYDGIEFNDKGFISHLVSYIDVNSSQGITHTTYDIAYNAEDRMSKITYVFKDADEKAIRTQFINLHWEAGLLKSVTFDNEGDISTTTYEYGNQENVHRQPSIAILSSLNLLYQDCSRPFFVAGYFGKGSDRFEISSHKESANSVEDASISVELDAEGKINVLHEWEDNGRHVDYTFSYRKM